MRPDITKVCSSCGEEKPLSEFHKDYRRAQGVMSECKRCHADRVWFATHEAEIEARYAVVDAAFGAGERSVSRPHVVITCDNDGWLVLKEGGR